MNHDTSFFEVRPIPKDEATLEHVMVGIQEGLEDIKKGKVYTQEQVEKMLCI